MSAQRPTIYDVARAAGVSKSLVSLVVRGVDRGVSDASRAAVEAAVRELGYRPSRAASELAASRSMTVGVVIDDYANPWFVDLLRGLGEVLHPEGYRLSVADAAGGAADEDPVEALLSMRADGIVVARDVPPSLGANMPPIVVAGTRADVPDGADAVANDDARGAALAVEHLVALGHRVIGHVAVLGGAGDARRESFVRTAAAAGVRGRIAPYRGPASEQAAFAAAVGLLREHPETTAVFAANDVMALGVLGAARELGLDVPGDLSVVGYDNTELAGTRVIDLTTIDDDSVSVGRESGRLLLARMQGAEPVGVRRTLEPTLVVRGTTGPA